MSQPVSVPGIDKAVEATLASLRNGNNVFLHGRFGAGKSEALSRLGDRLAKNSKVIHVALNRDDDAAPTALTYVASQLPTWSRDLEGFIRDPKVSWGAKLVKVEEGLAEDLVLLLDEPRLGPVTQLDPTIFEVRVRELSDALVRAKCRKVVTGTTAVANEFVSVEVSAVSVPSEILSASRWNGLGKHANALLEADRTGALAGYSPVELRLAVAAVFAGLEPSEVVHEHLRWRALLGRLLTLVKDDAALKAVLGRLAVLRTSFDATYLDAAGFKQLDPDSRTLLRRAILFGPDHALKLPDFVAHEANEREWLDRPMRLEAHKAAAAFHQQRFDQASAAGSVAPAVREEMEATHHLIQAGDVSLLDSARLFFTEQYDALGRALSLLGQDLKDNRRLLDAARAYSRALELDPRDWYAHHYLGFNLDMLGRESAKVADHYVTAVELFRQHVWLHRRLVCFLVTVGRMRDARTRWTSAPAELMPSGSAQHDDVYQQLHRYVAQAALYFGQLEFARAVLEDVPPRFRESLTWYGKYQQGLTLHAEAERDQVVFPARVAISERWHGPHLVNSGERGRVSSWTPGRIGSIDTEVHIRIAEPGAGAPRFGWRTMPLKEFRRLSPLKARVELPAAGTFLEIIRFKSGEEEVRLYDPTRSGDVALEVPFPAPDRYLRAFASEAGA